MHSSRKNKPQRCSVCGGIGHKSRTCQQATTYVTSTGAPAGYMPGRQQQPQPPSVEVPSASAVAMPTPLGSYVPGRAPPAELGAGVAEPGPAALPVAVAVGADSSEASPISPSAAASSALMPLAAVPALPPVVPVSTAGPAATGTLPVPSAPEQAPPAVETVPVLPKAMTDQVKQEPPRAVAPVVGAEEAAAANPIIPMPVAAAVNAA
uniref:Uncharacterized protein n=2 Tax=Emiliania huxleyi TaxID=2903 RepID=A0A7S3TPE6_EMIHU